MRDISFTAKVELVGITPMLQHACHLDSTPSERGPEKNYAEEWAETVYLSRSGKDIVVPAMNIEAMLRDASKGHKVGKHPMTRIVPTGVVVQEFEVPVLINGKKISIEDIRKNNWIFAVPATIKKNKIVRIRAEMPIGWELQFSLRVLTRLITPDILSDLLERAGYEAGLGDWRPGAPKPGKFGQFEIKSFKVE